MKKNSEILLASYIDALHPIIYINHFDFKVIDEIIGKIGQAVNIIEYNNALGIVDFKNKSPEMECSLEKFLLNNMDEGYENQTFIILKDIHNSLEEPKIIALLKRIAEDNLYRENYNATIFIISSKVVIPTELENYITVFDIPLPTNKEILEIINNFKEILDLQVDEDVLNDIALSFKGLNEFQIKQILNLAYQDGGYIDEEDKYLILQEKEQFIKKSGMLEMVNFKESIDDIGGLENLKDWLYRKAKVFNNLDKAIKFGVDIPKGIMIIGMPGCGKSLTAKATARLFEIPLVRLDVGRLLGKYVGESEENMRKALKLSEAISPCVLWIDEIEKAFSGIGSEGGGNDVTTRLFGQFLTWMQEKENTVFIVATANDISRIPPEFLRKGRFDELFSVDLPNGEERRKIIEIHLKKRNKWNKQINTITLTQETKGFNGADLEAVVKEAVESAFINEENKITTEDLMQAIKDTKSISNTLKDKIDQLQEMLKKINPKCASNSEKIEGTSVK
ncbi:AAA family ATPase [Clostridium botulinum]|nr:AAA family ATPase [Clostridium botulinum]